jgi:hypothetical protein
LKVLGIEQENMQMELNLIILSKWKPLWAFLPVETIIAYYSQLGKADAEGNATLGHSNDSKAIHDA